MQAPQADRRVRILETTLRDGTYELDFQFSPEDTAFLAAALDHAGFSCIEVSHGVGAGSQRWPKPPRGVRPLAYDEAHISAAASVVKRAALAALIVAGSRFTPMDELDHLRGLGIKVMRLAFEWQEMNDRVCLDYIDYAKKLGFIVSINLMQTYNVSTTELATSAREMERRGADWLYIVDSAGGMRPADVTDYVRAVLESSKLEVGLHAHNNSGLAIANSLAAVAAGATLVDTTLQGIGRATGNPSTEQILLALQKQGHEKHIDRELVFKLGDLARSLFAEKGNDPTNFVSGSALVHSRNVTPLMSHAAAHGLPGRELLYQVGCRAAERGQPLVDGDAEQAVRGVSVSATPVALAAETFAILGKGIERSGRSGILHASEELFARSRKRRKRTAMYLAPAAQSFFVATQPWEIAELVGSTVPFDKSVSLADIPSDRAPDVLAYDPSAVDAATVAKVKSAYHVALPLGSLVADAVSDLAALLHGGSPVAVRGDDAVAKAVQVRLRERGVELGDGDPKVVVCATLSPDLVESARPGQTMVVYGAGEARGVVAEVRRRGARVLRPLLAPVIAARIEAVVALEQRLTSPVEAQALFGVQAVDALVAPAGQEVVVDGLTHPTTLLDCSAHDMSRAAVELARRRVESWLAGKGPF